MRLKKGFSISEVLIVLIVVGIIATLSITSMSKGINQAQIKTGYKKAYNAISNWAIMEVVSDKMPKFADNSDNSARYFRSLDNALTVKTYADGQVINSGNPTNVNYRTCFNITSSAEVQQLGEDDPRGCAANAGFRNVTHSGGTTFSANTTAPWLVTEDNMAYTIVRSNGAIVDAAQGNSCLTKRAIAAQQSEAAMAQGSCAIVVVDVNGLSKGPNLLETQGFGDTILNDDAVLDELENDQYKIYIGRDGATPGHREGTVTGRIIADIE